MMAPLKITFVTGNKNKATDVQYILGDTVDLEIVDYDTPELQGTVEEIAIDKCRRAAEAVSCKFTKEFSTSNFLSLESL
jgi:inosine triphosphate pyrophosphatase